MSIPASFALLSVMLPMYRSNDGATFSTLDLLTAFVIVDQRATSFDRSTTAGVILVVLRAPTDEFGGSISASMGSYGRFDNRGAINIPVTGTPAIRFAGQLLQRSGSTDIPFNGSQPFDVTLWARNLTAKNYAVGGLWLKAVLHVTSQIYGEPHPFGAILSYWPLLPFRAVAIFTRP